MTSATVAAATTSARGASTAAAGGPEARISVIAVHPRRSAISNAAENVATRSRRTFRDISIAHSLGSGLRVGASNLCRAGGATCLQILPHGASITVGHGGV